MKPGRKPLAAIASAFSVCLMFVLAPAAMAADGVGLAGRTDDKMVTFICFGLIVFFTVLVIALSMIQARLDSRKDRRRHELDRFN